MGYRGAGSRRRPAARGGRGPVAILVHWLASNAWTLGQQHVLGRIVEREATALDVVAPPPPARAPKPGQEPVSRRGLPSQP
ncbi:hypothetical protein [Pseudonocardia pini]|uniref:hypothetical protein n=1 Tax=Pseudonocardia pini TaxID=2758030 RepID=UPI0015F03312|nr:hypothetical protein [Pseudonocardia pini]